MAGRGQKRLEAKERNRLFKDLYFLIQWLEDEDEDNVLYDAIPARDITPAEGGDVLNLVPGEECRASFGNQLYPATVVAVGKYTDIKKQQQEREKEAERNDMEMEIDNGGEDTGSIQTEKDVEKQGMSEQTNGDGGKSSKTAEKKSQMKEGMGDRTGQEKGDKRKRSNAAERGQKGEKGQGKDSGNIPSHNREDPEDGQGSVQKRSKGTEEHRSAPEKKDKTKTLASPKTHLTPSTKPKAVKRKLAAKRSPCKNVYISESGSEESEEGQKGGKGQGKDSGNIPSHNREDPEDGQGSVQKRSKGTEEHRSAPEKKDKTKTLASPKTQLTPSTKSKAVNRKLAAKRSPCKNVYISESSEEESEESSVQDMSRSEDEPQTSHGTLSSFEARRIKNIAENEMFKKMIGLGPAMLPTTITSEVTQLKEKVRVLEKSHMSLKRKLSDQEAEIDQLRRITSSEVSSSAEATPESSFSFLPPRGPLGARRSPVYNSPAYNSPAPIKREDTPHFLKGVDEVRLANAKLQSDAGSAALKLMDCVFSTAEMVNGNPSGVTRSKDETRQKTIHPLDAQKMRYIDAILQEKWGVTSVDKTIRRKMTQKCTDYFSDSRYKHLKLT